MKFTKVILIAAAMAAAKPQSSKAPVSMAHNSFQTGVGKVYEGYLNVQQALSNDDFQNAKTGSDSMMGAVKRTPIKGLDHSAKLSWDSTARHMTNILHALSSSKDLDAVRLHFKELTPVVTDAIEKFGMKSASSAYLFHCPMANANWMQKNKNKANPYYGKSMPECGSLIREVKMP